VSAGAILTKDAQDRGVREVSDRLRLLAERIGGPAVLFSVLFFFALLAFHRFEGTEVLVLGATWSAIVFVRPLEQLLLLREWIKDHKSPDLSATFLGSVLAYEFPRVLTIRHAGAADVEPGRVLVVPGADGRATLALALNYIGQASGAWLRALQLNVPERARLRLPKAWVEGGRCMMIAPNSSTADLIGDGFEELDRRASLIGTVAPETDVVRLRCDVCRSEAELEQGQLLEVSIHGRPVLYQLINGLTKEELLQQKHTRGFVLAEAHKIGYWEEALGRFEPVKWVPQPNAPVYLADAKEGASAREAIGHFPGTSYPVGVNTSDLVTHNTAILGILGVGKTFLALELVERMILDGIRVICLDLTDQYAQELAPYYQAEAQAQLWERLEKIGEEGKANVQKNVEEGGSVNEFRAELKKSLDEFLAPESEATLLVLNPNRFEVWRQDSKPYQNEASMATLTPAEITRNFAELTLEVLQDQGRTEDARCCLVLEEAHSLIPEWNSVAADGDKGATIGTGRAVLQGRKYGFGCLVVTQRTASVTKTILNQCNTVFAMRVYDATSMDFLANYIGKDYAAILSGLPSRNAVLFGKASTCADPVLIRVNEREEFLGAVRPEVDAVDAAAGVTD
jgi:hypothetical protein